MHIVTYAYKSYVDDITLQVWTGEISPVATNGYFQPFRCSEWSFFNIYFTDILLLSPHVAMWRPLAHVCIDYDEWYKSAILSHNFLFLVNSKHL